VCLDPVRNRVDTRSSGGRVEAVTLAPTSLPRATERERARRTIAMRLHGNLSRKALTTLASAMFIAGALAASSGTALGMPPPAFTLSPAQLSFDVTTDVNSFDYDFVQVGTGPRWLVYSNPTTATAPQFWDTQAGSCWQLYESQGKRIPGKTTCTIQVGFHSGVAGTFTGQLVVYRCLDWHLDPTFGMILCDVTGESQTIDLVGTATQA
jgi:hypothetical protein